MIWLIGGKGMLGSDIAEALSSEGIAFISSDAETDITDIEQLRDFAKNKEIRWIINCAAYTAVDKAESEQELAHKINATGVGNISEIATEINAKLIHFSTDYVFNGSETKPYDETDIPNPIGIYGKTKLAGEIILKEQCQKYFIFRISWLYGVYGNNFVKTMVRLFNEKSELGIVSDQIGAPTYTETLAENIAKLIKSESDKYGIYHYSDNGDISWFDFATEIKDQAVKEGLAPESVKLKPITTDMYPTPAKRPANSRFDKSKVKQLGFTINPWQENLKKYFAKLEKVQ